MLGPEAIRASRPLVMFLRTGSATLVAADNVCLIIQVVSMPPTDSEFGYKSRECAVGVFARP